MSDNMITEFTLERALNESISLEINNREQLITALVGNLSPIILPKESIEGLQVVISKPDKGAIVISNEDFDLVITLGAMIGVILNIMAGAPITAITECAVIIWSYWKLAIHLNEEETIVVRAIKNLQNEKSKKMYPTTSKIEKTLKAEGFEISNSRLIEILLSLGQKRNQYGSKCEVVEQINDCKRKKWGVIAY